MRRTKTPLSVNSPLPSVVVSTAAIVAITAFTAIRATTSTAAAIRSSSNSLLHITTEFHARTQP